MALRSLAVAVAVFASAAFAVADLDSDRQIPLGLASFLGEGETVSPLGRIAELEDQLRPLFEVLPKHAGAGLVDAESARYALQRHLLERHGWRVEALGGVRFRPSSAAKSAAGRLAGLLKTGSGFGLRELATLAAAVEKSVRMDSAELLSTALTLHGVSEQELDERTQDLIIQTFMLFFLLPDTDYTKHSSESIKGYLDMAERVYPGWTVTMQWVQGLKQTMLSEGGTLQSLVEQIPFGHRDVFDNQCSSLRGLLERFQQPGTGRVLVSKMRNINLATYIPNSIWHFTETNDELRSMGVLDESDPNRPTILIPNYMTADENCLPSSHIVSTCCPSECDALLAGIEGQFGSHAVAPEQLSGWARALAPNTSEALLTQLEEISKSHGGEVPLHGAAFAQWLHGAFPAKCPRQQDTRSWVAIAAAAVEVRWPGARWVLRGLALLVAVASGVVGLARSARPQTGDEKDKKVN